MNEIITHIGNAMTAAILIATFIKFFVYPIVVKVFNIDITTMGEKQAKILSINSNKKFEEIDEKFKEEREYNKVCFTQLEDKVVEIVEEFSENTNNGIKDIHTKITKIEEKLDTMEKKRLEGQERNELILEASTASLEAHKQNGANGAVTTALNKIEVYMRKKSS